MLRIFTPVKIQRLRPGLNPQTWLPEAIMLTTRPPKPSAFLCTLSAFLLLDTVFYSNPIKLNRLSSSTSSTSWSSLLLLLIKLVIYLKICLHYVKVKAKVTLEQGTMAPMWSRCTDMRRLMTGVRFEKCVVRRFRRCANVIECAYTNLDSIAYYTPRLYGIAYCS